MTTYIDNEVGQAVSNTLMIDEATRYYKECGYIYPCNDGKVSEIGIE